MRIVEFAEETISTMNKMDESTPLTGEPGQIQVNLKFLESKFILLIKDRRICCQVIHLE